MATKIIQSQRIALLNDCPVAAGDYVLYWMQQSQRAEYNHALEYAIQQANAHAQPLLVAFGLMADYPDANLRHYTFMLEGLQQTQAALARRGIKMVVQHGPPPDVALALGSKASLIVCDRGYLRHQKAWRQQVAKAAGCRVVQVESDVVVPVEVVTDKAEYAARTFRPKLQRHLDDYLIPLRTTPLAQASMTLPVHGLDLQDLHGVLDRLDLDTRVEPVSAFFKGGLSQAKQHLKVFMDGQLSHYERRRNQPHEDAVSYLSPYLHFGQISPLYVALRMHDSRDRLTHGPPQVYLEELLVRRELAMNYVHFTPNYDAFVSLPRWAWETLNDHQADARDPIYTRQQLERAETHDPYWNAAMQQMMYMGYLHNHLRMYWGKKILEWCRTPEAAFRTALALNNTYFLDGRDANSYTNVAWLFGLHDRPWQERQVFGKVRYMSASGLERKCDMPAYLERVDRLRAWRRLYHDLVTCEDGPCSIGH